MEQLSTRPMAARSNVRSVAQAETELVERGFCVLRGVEWPGFLALFGDPESGGGERHFMAYTVGWFGSDPFGLRTEQGTAVGDSRDEVAAENLAATFVAAEGPFPPTVVIGTERGDIVGSFTEDGAELITISAGTACGE